ncbi:MAG: cytochrome c biogenesis protein CcsA [Phycisphaerales bacterium]|nr:cytochrome c biogenesis protein CcsA [Phycisphaerales bacterium]
MIPHLIVSLAALTANAVAVPSDETRRALRFDAIRGMCVQFDGRYQPLDTLARDVARRITGTSEFQNRDPVELLLGWTFDPDKWESTPLIAIRNAELRAALQLPAARLVFSYRELVAHEPLRKLIIDASRAGSAGKPDALQSKVSKINDQLVLLQDVFHGEVIRPIPHTTDPVGEWMTIAPGRAAGSPDAAARQAWDAVRVAFRASDSPRFDSACAELTAALNSLPSAYQPDGSILATEVHYNRLHPFRTAWMVMSLGALVSATAAMVRRRWFDVLSIVVLIAGFGLLTYGMSLRWTIAGRIPASNMFESLLFVSWGTGAAAILAGLFVRHRAIPLIASSMGAMALILADCLPLDSFIRPAAPVLMDTIWMSIHVPVIMVSYSVLLLAVLVAHVQVGVMAAAPSRTGVIHRMDAMHYWLVQAGSILLFAGIATGSMWAASSWGRYWGWDPKEVWSLVAFLGYMAILHVRINHEHVPGWAYGVGLLLSMTVFAIIVSRMSPVTSGKLPAMAGTFLAVGLFVLAHGEFATAFKSILAFWLIVMTYVGVNYVLGTGLHSYGFGAGAVVRYMFLIGGIDLAIVGACTIIHLVRRRSRLPTRPFALGAAGNPV